MCVAPCARFGIALVAGVGQPGARHGRPRPQVYPTPAAAAEAFVDAVARHDDGAHEDGRRLATTPSTCLTARRIRRTSTRFLESWAKSGTAIVAGRRRQGVPRVSARTAGRCRSRSSTRPQGWRFDTQATSGGTAHPSHRPQRARGDPGRARLRGCAGGLRKVPTATGNGDGGLRARDRCRRPGSHDGLYWASPSRASRRARSAAEVAKAKAGPAATTAIMYRILTAQGQGRAGRREELRRRTAAMTGGHALVAWPAKWGETGVMSFIVSKDGVVYEKDLGPRSARIARVMTAFNPDASWAKVPPK
ncbi:MAG: DUF2950 domain-containing protein [Rhodopseudomonas palustris]|nr:DUF2950 domain-containing protein [Rhodopseudomonas palustris]